MYKTIKQLKLNHDRYCLLFFDNSNELFPKNGDMMISNEENNKNAIQYIEKQKIGGATDIDSALLKGIDIIKQDKTPIMGLLGSRAKHLIFRFV